MKVKIKVGKINYEVIQGHENRIYIDSINSIPVPEGVMLDLGNFDNLTPEKVYKCILKDCNDTENLSLSKKAVETDKLILKSLEKASHVVYLYRYKSATWNLKEHYLLLSISDTEQIGIYLDENQSKDAIFSMDSEGNLAVELSEDVKAKLLEEYQSQLEDDEDDLHIEQQKRKKIIAFRKEMDKIFK